MRWCTCSAIWVRVFFSSYLINLDQIRSDLIRSYPSNSFSSYLISSDQIRSYQTRSYKTKRTHLIWEIGMGMFVLRSNVRAFLWSFFLMLYTSPAPKSCYSLTFALFTQWTLFGFSDLYIIRQNIVKLDLILSSQCILLLTSNCYNFYIA